MKSCRVITLYEKETLFSKYEKPLSFYFILSGCILTTSPQSHFSLTHKHQYLGEDQEGKIRDTHAAAYVSGTALIVVDWKSYLQIHMEL